MRNKMLNRIANAFSIRLQVSEDVGKYVDTRRAAKWFFGLTLPYALAASALIAWRNSFQPNPGHAETTVRLLLIGIGFTIIFGLLYRAIVKPALLDYEAEVRRDSTNTLDKQDGR